MALTTKLCHALAIAAVAALMAAPSASAAEVGIVGDLTWGQSRADVDRQLTLARDAGVKWIRANVNWRWLEADGKGQIDPGVLAQYDYAVDAARAAGLEVLMPIADAVPYWASSDPDKHVDADGNRRWNRFYPPADMADLGDVVRFVVDRYADRGVHAYEIWNEPNTDWFWAPGPDAGQYVEMLKAAYPAAKQADPGATVVLGGLSKSDFEYLEDVYRAGGGPYFDAVAVHPYTYGVDPTVAWNGANAGEDPDRLSYNSFPAIREVKATMDAFGDSDKQVWITEFGYSTTSRDGGVSEARQAEYLTKAFEYVESLPWVHSLFWYQIRNNPFYDDADTYEGRFGLFTTDWQPKPAYEALRRYAAAPATGGGETDTGTGDTGAGDTDSGSDGSDPPAGKGNGKGRTKKPKTRGAKAAAIDRFASWRPRCARLRSARRCRPGLRAVRIHGRLPRGVAARGRVRLQLQRRARGGRWRTRTLRARVRRGRYSRRLRCARMRDGHWRVRAVVRTADSRIHSPFRRFPL